jgi:HlyD family secretion protein
VVVVSEGEDAEEVPEVEGVFLVREGKVTFKPVVLGIAGQEYFEAVSGLQVGDTVVAGPYQAVRNLVNGDQVRPAEAAAATRTTRPTPAP